MMSPLEDLLVTLVDAVPASADSADAELRLEVDSLELALPIESRLGGDGRFLASAPRGRVVTGFDLPHGSLAVVFIRSGT